MTKEMLVWIDAKYFCGGVVVNPKTRKIVDSCSICGKFKGQSLKSLLEWLRKKGQLNKFERCG